MPETDYYKIEKRADNVSVEAHRRAFVVAPYHRYFDNRKIVLFREEEDFCVVAPSVYYCFFENDRARIVVEKFKPAGEVRHRDGENVLREERVTLSHEFPPPRLANLEARSGHLS